MLSAAYNYSINLFAHLFVISLSNYVIPKTGSVDKNHCL